MKLLTSTTTPFGRLARMVARVHQLDIAEEIFSVWDERERVVGLNP